jgi:ribulose-5-phosphate 4-epimerase/fuculose-1-phosphate aldolase
MTVTPDAPSTTVPSIDGIPLTPKQVRVYGQEALAPAATVEEERLRRKQKLAGALRIFGRFGFGEGVAGHITVRDPEFPDHFWVNPLGISFRHVRVSDLILVNHDGEVVYGEYAVNRAAYCLHAAIHAARPDVIAAAHAHSVYGKAFSSLGRILDPLTQDSCAFYEDNVVVTDHGGVVVFDPEVGREFAASFPRGKVAIHQNHGHFTVGATVDEAVFWFVCFERCAQAQLAAMAAGTPKHIPHDSAVYTRENAGNAITGWMHFQPLWQEICRTDPDLFD